MRHLYLIAGRLCGLGAHVALDCGQYAAAQTQARTAWLCGDLAGHNGMRGWVRGVQSLIAYWEGRFDDAVALACDGRRYAADGTITVRLPSLEARACAAASDVRGTFKSLSVSERARERLQHDRDDPAGVFMFPEAKQSAYAGTALLALGGRDRVATAIAESMRAVELYTVGPPEERSSGDLLAARLDLANAHLENGDLDGMDQEFLVVMAALPEQRTASIIKRALGLGGRLAEPRYRGSSLAIQVREQIELFCAQPPALLNDGLGRQQ